MMKMGLKSQWDLSQDDNYIMTNEMKIVYKIFFLFMIVLSTVSCTKDLGNYSYVEINEVQIKNINDKYQILSGSELYINPKLTFSKDADYSADDYTFEWVSYSKEATQEDRKIINSEQNFAKQFPLGIGEYRIFYVVKEKSTGVTWQKEFKVEVTGSFNGGWAILHEVDAQAKLDYLEYSHSTKNYPKHFTDFNLLCNDPKTSKALALKGRPKFLTAWSNVIPATGFSQKYFLYIGTDKEVQKINMTDGAIWEDKYAFEFESGGLKNVDNIIPNSGQVAYATYDGNVYYRFGIFQLIFSTPINVLPNGKHINVAPHVAVYRNSGIPCALMYDIDAKRFIRHINYFGYISTNELPYNAAISAFNPNNVGKDLLWMGQTNAYNGKAYAVMKDDSRYYLARMDNNTNAFTASNWDDISLLPEIAKASHFEVDQQYGYLIYAVGGKLYQYDVDTKNAKLMKDFGEQQITLLKYNKGVAVDAFSALNPDLETTFGARFKSVLYDLICATYSLSSPKSSGKVTLFQVPQFNGALQESHSFSGFGKVVDVTSVELPLGW